MSTTPFRISCGGPLPLNQLSAFAESDDDENAMQDMACARSKAAELKVSRHDPLFRFTGCSMNHLNVGVLANIVIGRRKGVPLPRRATGTQLSAHGTRPWH